MNSYQFGGGGEGHDPQDLLTQCIPGWASSYIPISSKCVGLSEHKLPAGPLEGGGQ